MEYLIKKRKDRKWKNTKPRNKKTPRTFKKLLKEEKMKQEREEINGQKMKRKQLVRKKTKKMIDGSTERQKKKRQYKIHGSWTCLGNKRLKEVEKLALFFVKHHIY